ncbi:DUF4139 domain-containing protein [Marinobacterium arenosum]|uniref:DUF4139 domain-containing protein n=1 Tax=Marinobacterium arenosum TaxID=2862496 RepID=UPI001C9569A2|nr:hypothetical protein [Marinobacterium arenosum]MBY4676658.1 hypothetical protein [Marinobacterium arenosum]
MRPTLTALCFCSLLPASLALQAAPLKIGADQRESLSLTLYNQDLGLVRESRQLPPLQPNQLAVIEDVSARLQPNSLQIRGAGSILEQNHTADLLTHDNLLKHYVGKTLQLARTNPATGSETTQEVKLLALDRDRALISRGGFVESISLNSNWRFIFPALPENLSAQPSISFRSGGTDKAQSADINYLTSGLNWQMDYVLNLAADGKQASLNGLATLNNYTGSHFPDARISLLAGSVQAPQPQPYQPTQKRLAGMAMMEAADSNAPREALQDFHLYTLPKPLTLLNNQQKQVSLINARQFTLEKRYRLQFLVYPQPLAPDSQLKPGAILQFDNNKANKLGDPMPAGQVRVFSPDAQGQQQFIGASFMPHIAEDNKVRLELGQAFDVSIDRQQTQFEKTYDGHVISQQLRISNRSGRDSSIELIADFPRRWQIETSNHKFDNRGRSARWLIKLPAKGDALLSFRVRLYDK